MLAAAQIQICDYWHIMPDVFHRQRPIGHGHEYIVRVMPIGRAQRNGKNI